MKYAYIPRHRDRVPASALCAALGVSERGFHQFVQRRTRRPAGKRAPVDALALLTHIRAIHAETKGAYGRPRFHREPRRRGIRVGKERVEKMMREHAIRARSKKKSKATTDSGHGLPVSANLRDRDFAVDRPNRLWTGDITDLPTDEGWLSLAVVIDLFSRQVVGWSLGARITRALVIDALTMAWFRRRPPSGLLFHSDRGSQYASHDFQKTLSRFVVRGSMSRKGNGWDDAVTETLFGSLKVERLHGERYATRRHATDDALDWPTFYNRKRMHSTLGYVSPMEFEENWGASDEGKVR